MSIKVKVVLKNSSDKKPIANTNVALFIYQHRNSRIRPIQVGLGKSNANGLAQFNANVSVGPYLPRVLLKANIANKWQNLTAIPKSYNASSLDFGVVEVNTAQFVTIGAMRYVGMVNIAPPVATNTVTLNKYKAVEEKNIQLNAQLKTANTEKSKHLQELAKSNNELKKIQSEKKAEIDKNKTLSLKIATLEADNKAQVSALSTANAEILKLKADLFKKPVITENVSPEKSQPALKTRSLKAENVYSQALHAINKADQKGAEQGNFRISSAKMTLKVLSGEKEDEVRLIQNADAFKTISPGLMSVVEFDVTKKTDLTNDGKDGPAPSAPASLPIMPSLTGYTQIMAERKLAEVGFVANVYQQQLIPEKAEKQPQLIGQVIQQYPAAGKDIAQADEITLIIGVI